jgi:hypothetical protein
LTEGVWENFYDTHFEIMLKLGDRVRDKEAMADLKLMSGSIIPSFPFRQ